MYGAKNEPSKEIKSGDYVPCKYLWGYYGWAELWRHVKRCLLNSSGTKSAFGSVAAGDLLLPTSFSPSMMPLLGAMKMDCIYIVIIVQALYEITSHKLQQKLFQLLNLYKYVLYYISKVLRNRSGGKW